MKDIFDFLAIRCEEHADHSKSVGMKKYMKDNFDFFGIIAPLRKEIYKGVKEDFKLKYNEQIWELIAMLWQSEKREMQYLALDILVPMSKKMPSDKLPILEQMIVTKSWWDTVDVLAPNIVGPIFLSDINCRNSFVYKWMDSDNFWLQRSAIIFQLKYGKKTDTQIMMEAILKNDVSKEFFIRKAQGWALRQYSRFDPSFVTQFIEANPQLSGLTKKEALRLIS